MRVCLHIPKRTTLAGVTGKTPATPFGRGSRPGAFCADQPRASRYTSTVDGRYITMLSPRAVRRPWSPLRFSVGLQSTWNNSAKGQSYYSRVACNSQYLLCTIAVSAIAVSAIAEVSHPVGAQPLNPPRGRRLRGISPTPCMLWSVSEKVSSNRRPTILPGPVLSTTAGPPSFQRTRP
jgi:hypothetical protein